MLHSITQELDVGLAVGSSISICVRGWVGGMGPGGIDGVRVDTIDGLELERDVGLIDGLVLILDIG